MARPSLLLCLCFAAVAWPTMSEAQTAADCRIVAFETLSNVPREAGAPDGASLRQLRGTPSRPVEVRCGEVLLIAQEIDYLQPEGRLTARGQVVFQQTGTRIVAEVGEFNSSTRTGFFEDASGTLQLTDRQIDRSLFSGQEPEAYFSARRIEKTGVQSYRLTDAVFSACVQPSRRWEVTASRLSFTVDKYAIMRNAVLKVKEVPLLYLPVFYYPIQEDSRATGFLMPSYGTSTFRGLSLSNAFFWAIGRSQDATLYHDWFTSTGQGFGADYRHVGTSSSRADARVYVIREKAKLGDGGAVITPSRRSFEVKGNIAQSLPGRIRFQARADYFTDVTAQQLYQVDLASFSRRSRYFGADASGNWGRLRIAAQAERNDVFYGASSVTSYRTQPKASLSFAESPLGRTKVTIGANYDAVNYVRYDDLSDPDTRVGVIRRDGSVNIRAPLSLGSALTLGSSVSVRRTDWNLSRDPASGEFLNVPLSRTIVDARLRISGPVFTRVFNTPGSGFAERYKHVIEPYATVQKTSAFDRFNEVVQVDGVDTILGGATQVNYGIMNRLLARVRQEDGQASVREVMTLELSQTYYTNTLAANYDQQYQTSFAGLYYYSQPPSNLSPVRGVVTFSPSADLGAQFGLEYDTRFGAVRSYRASFNTTRPAFDLNGSWSKRQYIPGLQGFDNPLYADHFLQVSAHVRKPGGGASLGYSTTYDILRSRTLQQRIGGFYNAQCCGVAVDYAVTNLGHLGLRDDRRFSLSFTLAGVGAFSNLLGVFGNNGPQR